MSDPDRRLIEDYLPIRSINAAAAREHRARDGHIKMVHLWRARRPLVACRGSVYGALVPVTRFRPENGPVEKRDSLARANASKFVERLCSHPGEARSIEEAQKHILEAHAERLTEETGEQVTVEDIHAGRAPRPKVLDMFAGGGAIPLEALRLGCDAYALDLNPVAHIIELCSLVYPQKYGRPDPTVRGMTGPRNDAGETTWGGLAQEVRHWGKWVLEHARAEIDDLYPLIPDLSFKEARSDANQLALWEGSLDATLPNGYLMPFAYLWTRTVRCKNPSCGAAIPLARQTWLRKKKGRYVALKICVDELRRDICFQRVESSREDGVGFDPAAGSRGGNLTCPLCLTVADSKYVQAEGCARRVGRALLAVVAIRPGKRGKHYFAAQEVPAPLDEDRLWSRIEETCDREGLTVPDEPINPIRPSPNARGLSAVTRHGLATFGDLYTPRQHLCLLTFIRAVRRGTAAMAEIYPHDLVEAIGTSLALAIRPRRNNRTFGGLCVTVEWSHMGRFTCAQGPFSYTTAQFPSSSA